jgi:DUF4097 and DUF4098 domain-containing protein YvlB
MKQLAIASLFVVAASAASASTLQERFDKTYDVRPGSLFALGNTNGRINITSWDQPRVRIQAVREVSSRDNDAARAAMKELRIEVSAAGGGLRVATHYPKQHEGGVLEWIAGTNVNVNVTYDVTVPRQMSLEIENTNGALEIKNVQGALKLETTNGHIDLARCAGAVDAETTNGGITADLLSLTAGRPIRMETTNGAIHVALPRTAALQVNAANTNGSIETDLPVSVSGSRRKHDLRGTINGGGAELHLRTTNGGISIRSR